MTRYNQGRSDVQAQAAGRREARGMLISVCIVLGLFGAGITAVVLLGGCATTIAVKGELTEVGDHATLRGLVRVGQMGDDCASATESLKGAIAGQFVNARLPAPSSVEVRMLAGSSYCGFAQGTASEVTTLELGARNTAVVEVTAYWSAITYSELRRAKRVLDAMRPTPAAVSKTARNPAK